MVVIGMGLITLLEAVRQMETWRRIQGNDEAVQHARTLGHAVRETHRKFFSQAHSTDDDVGQALFTADGLRDVGRQCHEVSTPIEF